MNQAGPTKARVRRDLERLRRRWESLGRADPLWAVLANPAKRGRRWDVAEFFATGEQEIAQAMRRLDTLEVAVGHGVALDFGCGVGRLTRALAGRFDQCIGVDVSESMVNEARRLNPTLTFLHNPHGNLGLVRTSSVDFVYSRLVLQHVPPSLSLHYVLEFGRVLAPHGVAMFQIPTRGPRRSPLRRLARRALEAFRLRPPDLGGYAVPADEVKIAIGSAGMALIQSWGDSTAPGWEGMLYVAQKPA